MDMKRWMTENRLCGALTRVKSETVHYDCSLGFIMQNVNVNNVCLTEINNKLHVYRLFMYILVSWMVLFQNLQNKVIAAHYFSVHYGKFFEVLEN